MSPLPPPPVGGSRPTDRSGLEDRYLGALLGLAAGDALGTTLEFRPPGTFAPLTDMTGGGPFHLAPGQWTDDTSMALCLARSLAVRGGFDPRDQMDRYLRWRKTGYLSSTGACFDVGNTVLQALVRYVETGNPFSGPTDPMSAGNGSLMRLAPVPLAWRRNPAAAVRLAGESSRTTHGARAAVDACRYFSGLIVGALGGASKDELLGPGYAPVEGLWKGRPLVPEVAAVAAGSFKDKDPPGVRGTGYVVDSLEAALWAFHRSDGFREGALRAVNLGDDADTTGAVFGQIAGAYYGASGIPGGWLDRLARRERVEEAARALLALSEGNPVESFPGDE